LSQALGQFIELIIHKSPFVLVFSLGAIAQFGLLASAAVARTEPPTCAMLRFTPSKWDAAAVAVEVRVGLSLLRQPQRRQREACEADAEFLQRAAPRDGLGQALGQLIEFVVHNFPFVFVL
jgi:hypothetical protein